MAKLVFDEEDVRNLVNAVKKASGFPNTSMTLNEATAYANAIDPVYPVGIVATFDEDPGDDWVLLDGRELNIADYPILAEYFKMAYGKVNYFGGDGESKFGIADTDGLVPIMTSNTGTDAVASASSIYQNRYAYRAFDGYSDNSNYSHEWCGYKFPAWIQYKSNKKICVKKIYQENSYHAGNANNTLKDFIVQASNDGNSWVDLLSTTNPDSTSLHGTYWDIDNDTAYEYYRLYITSSYRNDANNPYVSIGRLQLYGRKKYIKAK